MENKGATVFSILLLSCSLFSAIAYSATTEHDANQLNEQAVVLYQQGRYQEAISLTQESLKIREKILGPDHTKVAVSLSNLAMMYSALDKYDEALSMQQRAQAIFEKTLGPNHVDTTNSLRNLGKLYQQLGLYDQALLMLQRALMIREKELGLNHFSVAHSLSSLGSIYQELGHYDQALLVNQRALKIREKVLGPDHPDTAESLNNLALIYENLGNYDEALPLLQRALAINEKILGSVHASTAASLNNLAQLYKTLGKYDEALPLLQRALAINEKIFGPDHTDTALSLNNLALLYETIDQYDKALLLYQRAQVIWENVLGPNHAYTATGLNNLAIIYQKLGNYDQALMRFLRALAIREKVLGPKHAHTASSLSNLALLYTDLNQYDQALLMNQRALDIFENSLGPDHIYAANSAGKISELYHLLGQYDRAVTYGERSLAILEKVLDPDHPDIARGLSNLAGTYVDLGQHEKALQLLHRAYRASQSTNIPDILKLVQGYLGVYYVRQSNPNAAIFYFKGAINTIQTIRGESSGLEMSLQESLLKKNELFYIVLADLLIEEGRLAEAQQVMSMLKEEEYFDFIRRDSKADNRHTRTSYNIAEKSFADQLEKLGREGSTLVDQLTVLEKQAKSGFTSEQEAQRARIKKLLAEQSKQTVALLNVLAQQLPTIKKQQITEAIAKDSLEQLRGTLTALGHGAVLLQYLVTDKRIHIILATPQSLLSRSVEISSKELHRKIAEFRRVLENPALDPRPLSRSLYELLIAPVAEDLKQANAQTLMLSLDGSLRYLPLGVLYDGKSYLAERYPLVMYTEVAKDKLREKPEALWKVAGFGITDKIGEFPPLPSVRQELEGIVRMDSRKMSGGVLPGNIYLNKDFTQVRLKDVLDRDYSVLHIASHFKFIPGTVTQSFLLLGDGGQLSLEKLRTDGWKFGSLDMMTLSACETAKGGGEDENGREIEGFGALVQRQGAKSVLATLWKVLDKSTAVLMESFYRLRQERGLNKADALREAQLVLISGKHPRQPIAVQKEEDGKPLNIANAPPYIPDPAKPYAHPYFWAPFILMGNWL